jgi:hypothetical protein
MKKKPKDAEAEAPKGNEEVSQGENKEIPQKSDFEIPGDKTALGVLGAITGAKVAGGVETSKKVLPILQTLYEKGTGSDAYMHRPQSQSSLQRYANTQLGHDLRVPLSELEKVTGKPIRTMSEVQDAVKQIQAQPRTAKTVSGQPSDWPASQDFHCSPSLRLICLSSSTHQHLQPKPQTKWHMALNWPRVHCHQSQRRHLVRWVVPMPPCLAMTHTTWP